MKNTFKNDSNFEFNKWLKHISNIKYCIFWETFYNMSHNIQTSCVHDDVYLNNKMKNTTTIKKSHKPGYAPSWINLYNIKCSS